ncbi:MAG: O-antigen ligase family protein [Candidatus Saccharibacteria bacterium]
MFLTFLLTVPFQTRIIYNKPQALIGDTVSYYLAIMVYLSDLLFVSALLSWLFTDFNKSFAKSRVFWLCLLAAAFPLISVFHVQQMGLFLFGWLKWVELMAIIVYISCNFNRKSEILGIYWVVFLSGIFQAVIAILQFHVQHGLGLTWLGEYVSPLGTPGLATIDVLGQKVLRAYGTFSHPNVLAGFLTVSFIAGLDLVSRGTIRTKLFVSLGILTLIFGLFLSFSRAAWLAAALSTIAYFYQFLKTRNYLTAKIMTILLIVSCGTIWLGFHDFIVSRATDLNNSKAVSYRTDFNAQAVTIWRQYPFTGAGLNNYVPALETMKPGLAGWQYQPPHNIFLLLGVETGIIGSLLLLVLVGFLVRFTWNRKTEHSFLVLTCLASFVILGLFDHYLLTIQQGMLMLGLILGLAAILPEQANEVK